MQTSEALVITAIFASTDDALCGAQALRAGGMTPERLRISAGCVLHVLVSNDELDRVSRELWACGAQDLSAAARPSDPGWLSHILERVIGAKVMPGEGDSEAGPVIRRL